MRTAGWPGWFLHELDSFAPLCILLLTTHTTVSAASAPATIQSATLISVGIVSFHLSGRSFIASAFSPLLSHIVPICFRAMRTERLWPLLPDDDRIACLVGVRIDNRCVA